MSKEFIPPTNEQLSEEREELRGIIVQFPEIMNEPPDSWFRKVAQEIALLEQNKKSLPNEVNLFLSPLLQKSRTILKHEAALGKKLEVPNITDEFRGMRAEANIMRLSREMAAIFAPELDDVPHIQVSTEELLSSHPDKFRMYESGEHNGLTMFGLRHPNTGEWYDAPLPPENTVWYKGGFARAILKASVNASYEEELPWNDLDVVFIGNDEEARYTAERMGVDPDGVELIGERNGTFDFTEYVHGRDITLNKVCFGNDGLHYSQDAHHSAKTGYIELVAEYMPNRAIYSVDKMHYKNMQLIKPRGAMRYVKTVTEGKATSFNYPEVNANFGLGVYSLVLAKRWSQREDFGIMMQRFFELCKRMKLVPNEMQDVYTFLEVTHARHPFFDMDKKITNMPDVARWKAAKIIKQIDREFGWTFDMPADFQLERRSNDDREKIITLNGFEPIPEESERITKRWPHFLAECQERKRVNDIIEPNNLSRYFYETDRSMIPEEEDET
jgi:hypothetical protein